MARKSRFVVPDVMRLPLFGGSLEDPDCEWIEVKSKLTYGDHQKIAGTIVDSLIIPNEIARDPKLLERYQNDLRLKLDTVLDDVYKLLVWLLDWNLLGEDGRVPEVSMDSVMALDMETARELHRVIDEYAAEQARVGKATVIKPV